MIGRLFYIYNKDSANRVQKQNSFDYDEVQPIFDLIL